MTHAKRFRLSAIAAAALFVTATIPASPAGLEQYSVDKGPAFSEGWTDFWTGFWRLFSGLGRFLGLDVGSAGPPVEKIPPYPDPHG